MKCDERRPPYISYCSLSILVLVPVLPAQAARLGEPPPLLADSVIRALADELSGSTARQIVQELSLHHRMRGSKGFRAAAEAIREHARSYDLEEVEILEAVASGASMVLVDFHPRPELALCDGPQALRLEQLPILADYAQRVRSAYDSATAAYAEASEEEEL